MFSLRKMNDDDLEMVLEWRNQPDIRKNMYTTHEISLAEHQAWYQNYKNDNTKQFFICVDEDSQPLGFLSFVDIDHNNKTASWAYFSGDLNRRGVGTQMEFLALNYAFEDLQLEKLNCEVLDFNTPVIAFHKKFGFKVEGVFKKHHVVDGRRADVYRLAMMKKDWLGYQKAYFEAKLNGNKQEQAVKVGQTYDKDFTITRDQIAQFSAVTGDHNPIHLDEAVAQKYGFDSVISHGFLAGSIFSQVFGVEFPGEGTIYMSQSMKFLKPIYPETQLKAQFKIVSLVGRRALVETQVLNAKGELALVGEAELLIPKQ